MPEGIKTKSALIFGGSRGIGRVVTEAFVSRGYAVTIVARTQQQLEVAAQALSVAGQIQGYIADVSELGEVQNSVNAHVEKFGRLDVVINTAATQGPIGLLWQNDPEAWQKTILTNLVGCFNVCRAAVPLLLKNEYGAIILFSGGGAAYARCHFSAYGASKTGVLRLVETLNEEIKDKGEKVNSKGVRIYAVAPGVVNTSMTEEVLAQKEKAGLKAYTEASKTKKEGGTPPERAAELCLFLAKTRPRCLAGRLVHVNEPYREYVKQFDNEKMGEQGLLRRMPYNYTVKPSEILR